MRYFLCVAALVVGPASAQAALCAGEQSASAIELGYGVYPDADIERAGLAREDSLFTDIDIGTDQWGLGHHYRAYEFQEAVIDPLQIDKLQTNGDVHQLSARWRWRQQGEGSEWRVGLAPLLSVSSNLLKNPDAIGSDAWQLHSYAEYRHSINREWQFLLGACVDDRFDHYRLYPLAGLIWEPQPGLRLRLAFPDSSVRYSVASRWQLYLSASPNGGAWQVYNEELDELSRFRYRGLRLSLGALWQISRQWQIGAEWGGDIERKFYFQRTSGDRRSAAADSARYAALRVIRRW